MRTAFFIFITISGPSPTPPPPLFPSPLELLWSTYTLNETIIVWISHLLKHILFNIRNDNNWWPRKPKILWYICLTSCIHIPYCIIRTLYHLIHSELLKQCKTIDRITTFFPFTKPLTITQSSAKFRWIQNISVPLFDSINIYRI